MPCTFLVYFGDFSVLGKGIKPKIFFKLKKVIFTNKYVIFSPRTSTVGRPVGLRAPQPSPYATPAAPAQQNKNSVLDKFKLFNNKDKNQERTKQTSSGVSKRTSSSSGFSSARSEHSDSSTSLCDQSKAQVEAPKTKALKSKLQTKPTKQISPKTARKEQAKAQSKIGRTKGPEKLAYNSEDVKTTSKISNIGTKLSGEKKGSNFDLLKQSIQLQKSNSSLPSLKQIPQETKIVPGSKTEKSLQRPKMELPAKISDPRIHLQSLKAPPNGINKDILMQKDHDEIIKDPDETFDKTLTMNHTNQSLSAEKACEEVSKGKQSPIQQSQHHGMDLIIEKNESSFKDSVDQNKGSHLENKGSHPQNEEMLGSVQIQIPNSPMSKHVLNSPPGSNIVAPGISPGSSIPKPTALVKGTSKPPKENNVPNIPTPTKHKSDTLHRKLDPNTVAMVSPMPSISDLMSESSHSNSNSTGQSNSSDSSVIYRPSSESGSEIKTIPNRKIDTTFEQMEKVSNPSATMSSMMLSLN